MSFLAAAAWNCLYVGLDAWNGFYVGLDSWDCLYLLCPTFWFHQGFLCLGHSNKAIFSPLLFPNFYNLFTFILGGQFLLPQRANNGKWGITQLKD